MKQLFPLLSQERCLMEKDLPVKVGLLFFLTPKTLYMNMTSSTYKRICIKSELSSGQPKTMEIQHHLPMETTSDPKYYLDCWESSEDRLLVAAFKVTQEYTERIYYSRNKGGITIYTGPGVLPSVVIREMDSLEYETLRGGIKEGSLTVDRYFSCYDEGMPVRDMSHTALWMGESLGAPVIPLDNSLSPRILKEYIPWIQGGRIVASPECIQYLEWLRRKLRVSTDKNEKWLVNCIDKIYEKITSI